MARGGYAGPRHTDEEKIWAEEVIGRFEDGKIRPKKVEALGLVGEFKKKFGRSVTVTGMNGWLRKIQDPMYGKSWGKGDKKEKVSTSVLKLLEQSKYVLYVFGAGVFGFETKDEVREYLLKKQPKESVRLFENVALAVKYNVEVEL